MKINFLMVLFTLSAHAVENKTAIHFGDFACQNEVQEFLTHWDVSKNAKWAKQVSTGDVVSWKAHGKKLGEWVSILATPKKETTLVHLLSDRTVEQVSFTQNNCSVKKVSGRLPAQADQSSGKKEDFLDEDLQKILTTNKNGLIYIWSPNMSLCESGIGEIKKTAAALGLPVDFIMDPVAEREGAQEMLKKLNLPASAALRMHSNELAGQSATLHYPALLVYKSGIVCNSIQRGWRSSDDYRKIAEEMFGECK